MGALLPDRLMAQEWRVPAGAAIHARAVERLELVERRRWLSDSVVPSGSKANVRFLESIFRDPPVSERTNIFIPAGTTNAREILRFDISKELERFLDDIVMPRQFASPFWRDA